MVYLMVHLDTETTGFSHTQHGVHSLGFVGEVVAETSEGVMSNVEYIGYWEFNPVGRERDATALTVGHVTHEELDARVPASEVGNEIRDAIDAMIEDCKNRYATIEVNMVGSYPQFDVRMIDGMDWEWKMERWFKDGENLVNTKDFIKDLEVRKVIEIPDHKLQTFVDTMGLRNTVIEENYKLSITTSIKCKGNANPFTVSKPHTAIYDCICGMATMQKCMELGACDAPVETPV